MSLLDYPISIENIAVIRPVSWQEEYSEVETINQTEAGTDVVDLTRRGKMTITAQFKCTESWAKTFMEWYGEDSLTVAVYDPVLGTMFEHNMRMRNFKKKTIRHSEFITVSNGLYEVSFKLIEF